MDNGKWWDEMVDALGEEEAMECAASDHRTLGISVSISSKDPELNLSKDITYTGYGMPKGPDKYELRARVDAISETIGFFKDKGWHTEFEFEASRLDDVLERLYEGYPEAASLRKEELGAFRKAGILILTGYWD